MENEITNNKFKLSILGALGIILLYNIIIAGIVQMPFSIISETMYFKNHETFRVAIILLGEMISNIIMVVLILKKIRRDWEINFKVKYIEKFNLKLLLCTIFIMLGFFLWNQSSIGIVVQKIPMPEFIEKAFEKMFVNPYSIFISVIVIAPIFEEILMRGIILEGFLNKYKPHTSIIASALIFGVLHLNIPQFINATIMGLIFGIIYYKTRSLILTIVGHMVNNTTAIIIAYINFSLNTITFIIGSIIFVVSAVLFIRYTKKLEDKKVDFEVNTWMDIK